MPFRTPIFADSNLLLKKQQKISKSIVPVFAIIGLLYSLPICLSYVRDLCKSRKKSHYNTNKMALYILVPVDIFLFRRIVTSKKKIMMLYGAQVIDDVFVLEDKCLGTTNTVLEDKIFERKLILLSNPVYVIQLQKIYFLLTIRYGGHVLTVKSAKYAIIFL